MLLNVRNPYRRQKRDSIIRSSFRRSYTGIENTCDQYYYLPPDHIDYFLLSYLLALRLYRLSYLFYDHIDYFLSFYLFAITSTTFYLPAFLRPYWLPITDIYIVDLSKIIYTRSVNQNRARFAMSRHGKSSS
jgi:hypothetical protein